VLEEAMVLKDRGRLEPADLRLDRLPPSPLPGSAGDAPTPEADRRTTALRLARATGSVSRAQLAAACAISGESARQVLHALAESDQRLRIGRGRATRYVSSDGA
jgi:hypothetical protein